MLNCWWQPGRLFPCVSLRPSSSSQHRLLSLPALLRFAPLASRVTGTRVNQIAIFALGKSCFVLSRYYRKCDLSFSPSTNTHLTKLSYTSIHNWYRCRGIRTCFTSRVPNPTRVSITHIGTDAGASPVITNTDFDEKCQECAVRFRIPSHFLRFLLRKHE